MIKRPKARFDLKDPRRIVALIVLLGLASCAGSSRRAASLERSNVVLTPSVSAPSQPAVATVSE